MSMPAEPTPTTPAQEGPPPGTTLQVPAADPAAQPQQTGITDTNNGFLTGVDPRQPAPQADPAAAAQQPPAQLVDQHSQQQDPATGRTFTEAEVARIRQEEKDKLYRRQEEMAATIEELRQAEVARQEQASQELEAADAARRAAEESALTETELLAKRQKELADELESLRTDNARKDALLEQEQRFQQLSNYRRDMIEASKEMIMPELRDLVVQGPDETAINASIEQMVDRTSAIVNNMQAVAQEQRRQTPGVSSTGAPPVGPMEQASSHESFSADDISNMDMATYIANRDRLLRASSPTYRG